MNGVFTARRISIEVARQSTLPLRELLLNEITTQQLQRLRQLWFAGPFAVANRIPSRLTEHLQKIVSHIRAGKLSGASSNGQSRVFLRDSSVTEQIASNNGSAVIGRASA